MAHLMIEVSADDFFEASESPGIVGPAKGDESSGWVVYLPGETPCICDSFDEAAAVLHHELKKASKAGSRR